MSDVSAKTPVFEADIAVIGAGAAGLMTAIYAARTGCANASSYSSASANIDHTRGVDPPELRHDTTRALRVVALDGAPRIGLQILVAGGGRCTVTHHAVREQDYAGSTNDVI